MTLTQKNESPGFDWEELNKLREEISSSPANLTPEEFEKFTYLFVRTLPRSNEV